MRRHRERCESLTGDQTLQPPGADADELTSGDDYFMMDMSDTLFSSLNPLTFNNPRDLCMYDDDDADSNSNHSVAR